MLINTYPFFKLQIQCRSSIFAGLTCRSYLINKHYNQAFCDIVPSIIANALNLVIYHETADHWYERITVAPWNASYWTVNIHRKGDHYIQLDHPGHSTIISHTEHSLQDSVPWKWENQVQFRATETSRIENQAACHECSFWCQDLDADFRKGSMLVPVSIRWFDSLMSHRQWWATQSHTG